MSEMNSPMTSPSFYTYNYPASCPSQSIPAPEMKREKRRYRCRKRSPATIERARVVRRDKANARERRRMNSLNDALEHLRTILPQLPDEPKMTKIETLRVAQGYIRYLSSILSQGEPENHCEGSIQSDPSPSYSECFPSPDYKPFYYSTNQHTY
ncbi:unnamed protein product [Auanema sp. JU1783]|nr:unnamed protein product [Auanema sp. JU1783]